MTFRIFLVDFVLDQKGVSLLEAYDKWKAWADEKVVFIILIITIFVIDFFKVCCDYAFHIGVTWWSDQVSQEMETLAKEKGESKPRFSSYNAEPWSRFRSQLI